MVVDSSSTDAGGVNGNLPHVGNSSMLLSFLHDTSSFSDRQVQIANAGTTNAPTPAEGHEPTPSRPNPDTADNTKSKKGDKPAED
ncbi:hypothetical protein CEP54_001993 [Fusarium duplospermum]|uniref:Uncharacterized protein n=1 Tax=Fusarium duplospermum TaxID=1325734 RepID=A0A428QX96_9HYPO|nr:hypothetical protein CEP54_001993 [Fusarium duplospermum]